jgi:hypothetical protein
MMKHMRKGLLVMTAILIVFASQPHVARAEVWGSNFGAAFIKEMLEKVARQLEGTLLSAFKSMAVNMLNKQINELIGGGSKGPLFITNWEDFIYRAARDQTNMVMNDFFTSTTRGKYTMANYVGVGDVNSVGQSYLGKMIQQAKMATTEPPAGPTYDLDAVVTSPDVIFTTGDWRGLNSMFANPANNVYGMTLMAERKFQSELSKNINLLTAEAVANKGFTSVKQDGYVITPGSTLADVVSSAKTLPDRIVASAENPGELVGGVLMSVLNKTVTNLVQQGIGKVQSRVAREVGSVGGAAGRFVANELITRGPGAAVADTVKQQTLIQVRSYTNPANQGYYDP